MANEYARVASSYISETMKMDQPTVLSSALEPVHPVAPRELFNMAMGFGLGGVLMAAYFVVRFLLDGRIKSPDDLRRYAGMATLALVPTNDDDMPFMRNRDDKSMSEAKD